ncbi:hypothetical protein Tco_0901215 [Tanacetum coccineum]
MAENVIVAGAENRPSMLEKGMYDSWKTRIWLYIKGKENGEMFIDSIKNGPFQFKEEITVPGANGTADVKRAQMVADLSPAEKIRYDCDIKIWDRVKELMEGTELTLQEYESKLYDEFDRFTFEPGELIHLYYWSYSGVGLSQRNECKRVRELNNYIRLNLALFENQYNPPPHTEDQDHIIIPPSYGVNDGNSQATGMRGVNNVTDVNANQSRVIRFFNCKGEGHIGKQCTSKKRVKDAEWFKEKMLLAQAHEAGVVLHEDQEDFLADRLEEMDDVSENITIFNLYDLVMFW